MNRNPLTDPVPGDWFSNDKREIRIDAIRNGQVYFVRFDPMIDDAIGAARVSIEDFRRLIVDEGGACIKAVT